MNLNKIRLYMKKIIASPSRCKPEPIKKSKFLKIAAGGLVNNGLDINIESLMVTDLNQFSNDLKFCSEKLTRLRLSGTTSKTATHTKRHPKPKLDFSGCPKLLEITLDGVQGVTIVLPTPLSDSIAIHRFFSATDITFIVQTIQDKNFLIKTLKAVSLMSLFNSLIPGSDPFAYQVIWNVNYGRG